MAKHESILSDFHEDKVEPELGSSTVKPKAELDRSQAEAPAPESPKEDKAKTD